MKAFRTRPTAVNSCRALGFTVYDLGGKPVAAYDPENVELARIKNINARNEPVFDLPHPEFLQEWAIDENPR